MKLRYTLPALADLNSVLDYIAAHSPRGAFMPAYRRSSIFYEATETEIIIHAVRHAARDPAGMPGGRG